LSKEIDNVLINVNDITSFGRLQISGKRQRYVTLQTSGVRRMYEAIKLQVSSTKLQINLKLQKSMTKTFSIIVSYRLANPGLSTMMLRCKIVKWVHVWIFVFE